MARNQSSRQDVIRGKYMRWIRKIIPEDELNEYDYDALLFDRLDCIYEEVIVIRESGRIPFGRIELEIIQFFVAFHLCRLKEPVLKAINDLLTELGYLGYKRHPWRARQRKEALRKRGVSKEELVKKFRRFVVPAIPEPIVPDIPELVISSIPEPVISSIPEPVISDTPDGIISPSSPQSMDPSIPWQLPNMPWSFDLSDLQDHFPLSTGEWRSDPTTTQGSVFPVIDMETPENSLPMVNYENSYSGDNLLLGYADCEEEGDPKRWEQTINENFHSNKQGTEYNGALDNQETESYHMF